MNIKSFNKKIQDITKKFLKERVDYVYLLAANGVFFVSGYVIHFFLGKHILTVEDYGLYGWVLNIFLTVSLLFTSGFTFILNRQIALDKGKEFKNKDRALLLRTLVIGSVIFVFTTGIIVALTAFPGIKLFRENTKSLVILIPLLIPAYFLHSLLLNVLNGLHKFKHQGIILALFSIFRALFIVAMGYLWGLQGALLGNGIPGLLTFLVMAYYLKPFEKSGEKVPKIKKEYLYRGIVLTIYSFLANIFLNLDTFILERIGTATELGIYIAALTIGRLPIYIINAISAVTFSKFAKFFPSANSKKKIKLLLEYWGLEFAAMVVSVIAVILAAPLLVDLLYGARFERAIDLVAGYTISTALAGWLISTLQKVQALKQDSESLFVIIVTIFMGIPLGIFLYNAFGIESLVWTLGIVSIPGLLSVATVISAQLLRK